MFIPAVPEADCVNPRYTLLEVVLLGCGLKATDPPLTFNVPSPGSRTALLRTRDLPRWFIWSLT
jgi:hypothetical protein